MRGLARTAVAVVAAAFTLFANGAAPEAEPSIVYGAQTYKTRCILCHGQHGYGDGNLPLSLQNEYPNTNLHKNHHGFDIASIRKAVIHGGSRGDMHNEMPPWGDELTHTQLESVTMFVHFLLTNPDEAQTLLERTKVPVAPSEKAGRILFRNYCALCHGRFGEGNGKMARIINDPPPFNLTLSRVPPEYIRQMVQRGGEAMNRSPRMPPFETQLSENEMRSLILYVMSLRTPDNL